MADSLSGGAQNNPAHLRAVDGCDCTKSDASGHAWLPDIRNCAGTTGEDHSFQNSRGLLKKECQEVSGAAPQAEAMVSMYEM
mmetsp:Transcript_123581/g.360891  ORF Transcript_123581/g.360891 Transcript_123581/m.360891 type:complete len:82 (-) Transcript_123581:419-664(-)